MAIDLARLTIEVDTTDLERAGASFSKLAVNGQVAEAAVQKTSAGLAKAGVQARAYGAQVQSAGGQTANIVSQFNDIGVMLAAGQSPMMLALQQGTQLNQVFMTMGSGRQVLSALGASFTAMINPMSLATIGIIAGGAALVQWGVSAFGATEEAKRLVESLKEIEQNAKDATASLREARLGVTPQELQAMDALQAKVAEIAMLRADMEGMNNRQLRNARAELGILEDQRATLADQLNEIQRAQTEVGLLRDGMSEAAIEALKFADVDLAKPIWEGARAAAELAARLNISFQAASGIMLENENLAAQYEQYGQGRQAAGKLISSGYKLPKDSGRSEAARKWEATQREAKALMDAARTSAEKYADEVARVKELQAMGALTGADAAKIIGQITKKYTEAGEAAKFWDQTQTTFNKGLLDAIANGGDLSDVFQNLAKSIAKAALEAALFNSGPLSGALGGGGGIGGLIGGLFGGFRADGGPVSAGKAYVVGERGPEVFVPSGGGSIVPNGAGGGVVQVHVVPTPYFDARVQEVSGSVAAQVVSANNDAMSDRQRAASWG